MKSRFAVVLVLLLFSVFSYAGNSRFSKVIIFGDSLSDTGRIYALTGGAIPPSPPYYNGRFSNGPNWAEYFVPKFQPYYIPGDNYAYGGAKTGDSNFLDQPGIEFPGVFDELDQFEFELAQAGQTADPDALYIVWAGPNDVFDIGDDPAGVIVQAISNMGVIIDRLQRLGARHIVVGLVPDLGITPLGYLTGQGEQLTFISQAMNDGYQSVIRAYSDRILVVDIFSFMRKVAANAEDYELTNVTEACLNQPGGFCGNPDEFLFWDEVHPTTRGHEILAQVYKRCVRSHSNCFKDSHADKSVDCFCTPNPKKSGHEEHAD